jgi:hypothetical protein
MMMEDDMAGYAQQGAPDMLAPITKLKLELTITAVSNGVATFTLEGDDPEDKKHVNSNTKKVTIPAGSRDVKIEFDLDDDSGNDLEFCRADPIWVSRTETCPQSSCSDPQIIDIEAKREKLNIRDLNTDDVELGYTLILEGDCGRVIVDPIIKNNP